METEYTAYVTIQSLVNFVYGLGHILKFLLLMEPVFSPYVGRRCLTKMNSSTRTEKKTVLGALERRPTIPYDSLTDLKKKIIKLSLHNLFKYEFWGKSILLMWCGRHSLWSSTPSDNPGGCSMESREISQWLVAPATTALSNPPLQVQRVDRTADCFECSKEGHQANDCKWLMVTLLVDLTYIHTKE